MLPSLLSSPSVKKLVTLALEEDLQFGDITAAITVDAARMASATIVAKERFIVCGTAMASIVNEVSGGGLSIELLTSDGSEVEEKTTLATLRGSATTLLSLERTILNFMQRMSGVATHTKHFVAAAGGKITVLDTRKTLPGWRALDKYSVAVGGGKNHRYSLGDMILVKNNHIDANPGGIQEALKRVAMQKPPYMGWEVEVRTISELKEALPFSPDIIMLDNFTDEMVIEACKVLAPVSPRPLVEVSGGITSDRARVLAEMGVDAVSVGALTTAARNVDISMRITLQ
jgi:nicotinate-nucleotide pyrophosphorylase (carboxylating)